MESAIAQFFAGIVKILLAGLTDWRIWFINGVTWVLLLRLKFLWDEMRPAKRRRVNEAVAFLSAAGLTLWVYWQEPYMLQMALAMGLFNPLFYKFFVGAVGHYKPEWVQWMKSKQYTVTETENGGIAVREDNEKTIRLTPEELKKRRGE